MRSRMLGRALTALLLLSGAAIAANKQDSAVPKTDAEITARVTHEIGMYPYYDIWDMVGVQVEDGCVSLSGAVSQPFKKNEIERIVKETPGVAGVEDQIEVLPLSNQDDRLRLQIARAIYSDPTLSRFASLARPPIHIIVENGHVTLSGVVENELQKNVAGVRASSVGMSFGPVVNNLAVENPPAKKKA
jgi:hyperosmotically inducible protein